VRLADWIETAPYTGYAYSYPHKSAYRRFDAPLALEDVWANERRDALFLYLHVPYCEQRCGFCNLFTLAKPGSDGPARFIDQLERQARVVRAAIQPESFARIAIGGGTPSYLSVDQLARLFDVIEGMGADPRQAPMGIEVSPETVTPAKLALMVDRGVDRVSIGIQSFIHAETRALGRAQPPEKAHAALRMIRDAGPRVLNLDLIYGGGHQTPDSFRESIDQALEYAPEEIYLYPLYTRPLTGLGRSKKAWDDHRIALYRTGRAHLLAAGYVQVSMRMFRRAGVPGRAMPTYRCAEDGMIGLGPGARSYTRTVHYCTEFAVSRKGVAAILEDWLSAPAESFALAHHGIQLDAEERMRRAVILGLLSDEGLAPDLAAQLPVLTELTDLGLAQADSDALRLTPAGIERADVIGPWLYSERVQRLSGAFELR
jgi:oxygen-independent coproporphyrinogen-3 oxidase